MKKVLLLNPPFLPNFSRDSRSPAVTRSGTLYYPIWLSYAASFLLKKKIKVDLLDAVTEITSWKQFTKQLIDVNYDIIVIHTSTPSIESDIGIAQDIKKELPTARIYLTGTHPSALPEETLGNAKGIDGVIAGEMENALSDIVAGIAEKDVRGLVYRKDNNIFKGKEPEPLKDLGELGWVSKVYRKYLNINKYFYSALRFPVMTIHGGRGCAFNCSFCVLPQVFSGHNVRLRDIDDILGELTYIREEMPWVKEIMFEDDTFTLNHHWVQELCYRIRKENLKITWSANARADLDIKTMFYMKAAGLRLLFVGFESPHQKTLDSLNKGITVKQQEEFIMHAKKAKILVHGAFIFGLPGETVLDMSETVDYAKKIDPDTCQFYPLIPYPGTKIYDELKTKGYLKFDSYRDYLDKKGHHSTILNYPEISANQIKLMCLYARSAYYKRPGYVFKKIFQALSSPAEAQRIIRAFMHFRKHY